jgi:general stress protein 26
MAKRKSNTVKKVAKLMRDLDICMLTTSSARGGLHARPMSNNGQVEFDGDVWFFSAADSRKVREIEASPRVHLSYADLERSRFISMAGRARIVRNAKKKQQLWLKELDRWFEDGPDSEAIVLIKVTPTLVSYWTRNDEGEVRLK